MNRILLFILLALAFSGCDAPRRTRAPTFIEKNNNLDPYNSGYKSNSFQSSNGNWTDNGQGPSSNSSNASGFERCDLSYKHHTIDVGHFGICQSLRDETQFKIKIQAASLQIKTCLIPTYKDASGASTFLGDPQCTFNQQEQIIEGRLYKNRQGYGNFPINGVIVMKEPLLPQYVSCMRSYIHWPANLCVPPFQPNSPCQVLVGRCPNGAQTNPYCDSEARRYMAEVCNNFKSRYAYAYADIRLF